jgi:hypothetical protein
MAHLEVLFRFGTERVCPRAGQIFAKSSRCARASRGRPGGRRAPLFAAVVRGDRQLRRAGRAHAETSKARAHGAQRSCTVGRRARAGGQAGAEAVHQGAGGGAWRGDDRCGRKEGARERALSRPHGCQAVRAVKAVGPAGAPSKPDATPPRAHETAGSTARGVRCGNTRGARRRRGVATSRLETLVKTRGYLVLFGQFKTLSGGSYFKSF